MTIITEDYVSDETFKLLKEKGFDDSCCRFVVESNKTYHRGAPTLQMATKWLREIHYLHITVHSGVSEYGLVWTYAIVFVKEVGKGETHFYKISQITTPIVKSKSYEQACELAIKHCLNKLI